MKEGLPIDPIDAKKEQRIKLLANTYIVGGVLGIIAGIVSGNPLGAVGVAPLVMGTGIKLIYRS